MNEFYAKYGKYLIPLVGTVVLILIVVVVSIFFSKSNEPIDQNPPETVSNNLDYQFLNNQTYSEQDQYLMLTAKILVEGFGTYSYQDTRGLQDLQNQSTESFKKIVNDKLASITSQVNFETSVDPNSVKLERTNESTVVVVMTGVEKNLATGSQKNIEVATQLVKTGDYWLVNNILIK